MSRFPMPCSGSQAKKKAQKQYMFQDFSTLVHDRCCCSILHGQNNQVGDGQETGLFLSVLSKKSDNCNQP
jgi:hypothetical protein